MGIWNKIFGGVERFFKDLASEISLTFAGMGAGMAVGGPIGAAIGGLIGVTAGSVIGGVHMAQYITSEDEPDAKTTAKNLMGMGVLATSAAIKGGAAGDDAAAAMGRVAAAVAGGGTARSSYQAAGLSQFPGAITMGAIQGQSNRTAATLGIAPTTAVALGNGAVRGSLSGSSSMMRGVVHHNVYSASMPLIRGVTAPAAQQSLGGIQASAV